MDFDWSKFKHIFVRREDLSSIIDTEPELNQKPNYSDLNWAEYLQDERHQYLMGVPSDLDDFKLYDSWDIDTACQVLTLSCKLDMEKQRAIKLTPITFPHLDALRAGTICGVYDRARGLAESSVKAGNIKEHDTPENWIKWAQGKGYSVSHLMTNGVPAAKVEVAQVPSLSDEDWMVQARVIADAIGLEKWNLGIRQITARSICDAVATRLGKNQKYCGTQGPRAANAIRSVALKGWKFIQPSGTNGTNGTNE